MSGEAPRSPVEKFLGPAATAGGPFALLALAPEDCTQELIIVQLQRQLKRVASHADAATHSADEVRLALHAAAAQLLEGISRSAANQQAATETPDDEEETTSAPALPGTMSPGLLAMEGDIIATMAMCGGWNAQCMHRLALIAHSRGVSQEDFLAAIEAFVTRPAASASGPASQLVEMEREARASRAIPAAPPDEQDPTKRIIATGLIVIVVGLALLGGLIYIVATVTMRNSSKPTVAAGDQPAEVVEDSAPDRTKPTELFPSDANSKPAAQDQPTGPVPVTYKDPGALLRDLRALAEGTKPASSAQFAEIIAAARDLWPKATPDVQEAISVACVDYLYRIQGDQAARREALSACAAGASNVAASAWTGAQVRAAVFSAGLIARLARERELPGDIVDPIQALSRDSLFRTMSLGDSSFAGGATSACIEIARRLIPKDRIEAAGGDAWSAWLECVGAIGLDEQRKDRVILQALDTILRSEREPHQSKPIFDAVVTLSKGFSWTDGEESRSRLIWWFIDPDISSSDLHAVTLAATQSGLSAGLDASMILGSGAGESERAAMRDRYREAWGESVSAGRNAVSQAFVDAAEAALRATSAPTVDDRLATALWYSQLVEVAESAWYASAGPSAPTSKPSTSAAPAAPPWQTTLHFSLDTPAASSSWVVQYLSQRTRIPERKQLLSTYAPSSDSTLSIEAAVIVADALRGSPHDIRAAAADVLRANASSPAFVNAFLNESAMMPLTRNNAQLAAEVSQGRIVSLRNPTFRVVMRRSLVERLLELLSSDGELSKVDGLSTSLAESYQRRAKFAADAAGKDPARQQATEETAADEESPTSQSGSVPPIERSARHLRLAVEDEAKRQLPSGKEITTLQQIRFERIARAKAVQGRPQQFVAEQASAVDLLAYVVVAEAPQRAPAVREIIDAFSTHRRSAAHVTEQIEAGERAMLKLWLLRVKGEAS